jgi:formiminotetrahydrofolate cyclodeaminase
MESSVWTGTLAGFREKAASADPVPAGVAISAVTASIAIGLLAKVLSIARKKKALSGDVQRLDMLLDAARSESTLLTHLADDDIRAFNQYMDAVRNGLDVNTAIHKAIEVPMNAARSAVRGLELCAEAAGFVRGMTEADLGAAVALLSGAVRAILLSVDSNVRELRSDEQFSDTITGERRQLESNALRHADAVAAASKR